MQDFPRDIRALFLDIDGTLLDPAKMVPPSALAAIQACRRKGLAVYAATGRAQNLAAQFADSWHPDLPVEGVFHNGACIRLDGQEQYHCLPVDALQKLVALLSPADNLNISLQYHDMGTSFLHDLAHDQYRLWGIHGQSGAYLAPWPAATGARCNPEQLQGVLKLMVFPRGPWGTHGDLRSWHALLEKELGRTLGLCLSDGGAIIQVMHPGVSKRSGIHQLLQLKGLAEHQIAVFGDDVNDLEMLAAFPHSVAMGNAPDHVKQAARHVTRANNADGLAWALEQILGIL